MAGPCISWFWMRITETGWVNSEHTSCGMDREKSYLLCKQTSIQGAWTAGHSWICRIVIHGLLYNLFRYRFENYSNSYESLTRRRFSNVLRWRRLSNRATGVQVSWCCMVQIPSSHCHRLTFIALFILIANVGYTASQVNVHNTNTTRTLWPFLSTSLISSIVKTS